MHTKVITVFGPPGTGKTTELVNLAQGHRGLFLSYTRTAAAEAASRVVGSSQLKASTLHSLAFNALSMNRSVVVDPEKLKGYAKDTGIQFKGTEVGVDELQEGDEFMAVLSFANNRQMQAMEAFEHFGCPGARDRFSMFVNTYAEWKKTFGYMDFDDMLKYFVADPDRRFPMPVQKGSSMFLDEAQDCSSLQWSAFKKAIRLIEPTRIVIAGDDDQAIYEWSGANPHGMIEFSEPDALADFIESPISYERRILRQSHRVPKAVLRRAVEVVTKISKRVDKTYYAKPAPGTVEAWGDVFNVMDRLRQIAPDGALILVRDRFRMEELKRGLNRELVPYSVIGGYGPWDSKIANALRAGEKPAIPPAWREFYAQADLTKPLTYKLSTIHSAKGREHDTVILDLDCPARVLNGIALDPDAETRVQYVGLTRAANKLILCGSNPIV